LRALKFNETVSWERKVAINFSSQYHRSHLHVYIYQYKVLCKYYEVGYYLVVLLSNKNCHKIAVGYNE